MKITKELLQDNPSRERCNSEEQAKAGLADVRILPRIPNIRSMYLQGAVMDYDFLDHGVGRNVPRKITFRLLNPRDDINRYLIHTENRLKTLKARGDWKTFGLVSNRLVRRSLCFYLLALRQVKPTWYKDMPLKKVIGLYNCYKRFVRKNRVLTLTRVGIDKPCGGRRPLGVPSIICRLLLYQVNKILQIAFLGQISDHQHAYMPNKGTLTAGREVIGRVLPAKYIYEFDLTKFFDTVNQIYVTQTLTNTVKCEGPLKDMIIKHLESGVETPSKDDPLHEPDQAFKKGKHDFFEGKAKPETSDIAKQFGFDLFDENRAVPMSMFNPLGNLPGFGSAPAGLSGVPQGANTSPLLAISCLTPIFDGAKRFGHNIVMYADDGIIYSNQPIDIENLFNDLDIKSAGIKFNQRKSGWIKNSDGGVNNLKFLGLVYDHKDDVLRSHTRNGAQLTFDKHDLITAIKYRENDDGQASKILAHDLPRNAWGFKWKDFMFTNALGFIQSRMYEGEGNPIETLRVTTLKGKSSSGIGRNIKEHKDLTLANASSYAYDSLRAILQGKVRKVRRDEADPVEYEYSPELRAYLKCEKGWYGIEGRIRHTKVGFLGSKYRNHPILGEEMEPQDMAAAMHEHIAASKYGGNMPGFGAIDETAIAVNVKYRTGPSTGKKSVSLMPGFGQIYHFPDGEKPILVKERDPQDAATALPKHTAAAKYGGDMPGFGAIDDT